MLEKKLEQRDLFEQELVGKLDEMSRKYKQRTAAFIELEGLNTQLRHENDCMIKQNQ